MKKTLAIISIDSPSDIKEALLRDGFDVLLLPPSPHLQTPVRSHADMLIFPIGDTVFCHESYASENQKYAGDGAASGRYSPAGSDSRL